MPELSTLGCESVMQIGYTKSFKKAVVTFCLVGLLFWVIDFGSYYFGLFGFSLVPFPHWQDNGLWWVLYRDACRSAAGAFAAAVVVYIITRRMRDEKPKDAA